MWTRDGIDTYWYTPAILDVKSSAFVGPFRLGPRWEDGLLGLLLRCLVVAPLGLWQAVHVLVELFFVPLRWQDMAVAPRFRWRREKHRKYSSSCFFWEMSFINLYHIFKAIQGNSTDGFWKEKPGRSLLFGSFWHRLSLGVILTYWPPEYQTIHLVPCGFAHVWTADWAVNSPSDPNPGVRWRDAIW